MRTSLAMIACTLLWFHFSGPLHAAEGKKPKPSKADEEIKAALAKVLPAAKACYDAEAKNTRGLEGRITFSIKAGKDGSVDEVKVEKDELGSAPVAACIMGKLKDAKLPPAAKNKTISHPFIFSPTRTLAILPFDNMTGDKSLDWLKSGAPESLMTKLGQIPSLVLVDRLKLDAVINEQALGQSGAIDEKTAIKAGKVVSAQLVIVGAFQKAGKKTRFTARVVDVETGKVRQLAEADGKLDDVFAVQDALAKKLCDTMNIMPTPETDAALALRVASSVPLLEMLGKAETSLKGAGEPADRKKAAMLFRQLIEADPKIPEGYYGLARALWVGEPVKGSADEVEGSLKKALEIRPGYYEALILLSFKFWLDGKIDESFELSKKASALKPDYALGYYGIAIGYASKGKADEALEMCKQAMDMDPQDAEYSTQYGQLLAVFKRDFREAKKHTAAGLAMKGAGMWNYLTHAYVQLMSGDAAGCLVTKATARKTVPIHDQERMKQDSQTVDIACLLRAGKSAEAQRLWDSLPPEHELKQFMKSGVAVSERWPAFVRIWHQDLFDEIRPVFGKQIGDGGN